MLARWDFGIYKRCSSGSFCTEVPVVVARNEEILKIENQNTMRPAKPITTMYT
jgi:hypothetical protein